MMPGPAMCPYVSISKIYLTKCTITQYSFIFVFYVLVQVELEDSGGLRGLDKVLECDRIVLSAF